MPLPTQIDARLAALGVRTSDVEERFVVALARSLFTVAIPAGLDAVETCA